MPNQIIRRTLLTGLAAAWCAKSGASAAEQAGRVDTSRGDCYAQSAAERRVLAPSAPVFIGDTVGTGVQSALAMHLGAATEVKLGPELQLRIDRFVINAGGILVLEHGGMLYDHNTSGGPNDVTVRGPFGLIAVRGTRFFAGPSNGVFGVFVERGAVTVVGVNTAVLVESGLGTNIASPGAEPTPRAPWGKARIDSAMRSFD